jgi:phage-related protein
MEIENFNKVFNFFGTIFSEMATIIEPIVNELLAPLVGMLEIIGNLIGQILVAILTPLVHTLEPIFMLLSSVLAVLQGIIPIVALIITVVMELVNVFLPFFEILQLFSGLIMWLWNEILAPICWAIYSVVSAVYNGLASVFNAMADALNWIPGVNIHRMTKLESKSISDFKVKGNAAELQYESNGDSYSNTSASSASAASGSASYTAARDIIVNINYHNSYVNGDAREIAVNLRNEIRMAEALGL